MSEEILILNEANLDNLDLTSIDLNRALVKDGELVELQISKFEVKPNKAKQANPQDPKAGDVLNITFTLSSPTVSTKGEVIYPPFEVYDVVSLVSTDKYNPLERLASIMLAATGAQGKFVRADLLGQKLIARMKVEDEQNGFPAKNRISRYIKKK